VLTKSWGDYSRTGRDRTSRGSRASSDRAGATTETEGTSQRIVRPDISGKDGDWSRVVSNGLCVSMFYQFAFSSVKTRLQCAS